MQRLQELPECTTTFSGKTSPLPASERWLDDAYIIDMDYFIETLSSIKVKDTRPDLIGSIITHYASKWLPNLTEHEKVEESPKSVTASWVKKKFFIETIIGILPPDTDCVPCNFLLRILRAANMVGVEPTYCAELEKRVSCQLDQASLRELMIPSFSHTSATLLDVELVKRLVIVFLKMEEVARTGSAAALVKVAKLVDCYLAEVAVDSHLELTDFVGLANVLPSHARATDDRLYRAVDTFLKAHPGLSKQEKKKLCNLIDCRKLSPEASAHAAQNERLPVRAVIQVLLSEQTKLYNHIEWSGSQLSSQRSVVGLDGPGRSQSKRESIQQLEIQRLKEDVLRLQCQCMNMEKQIDKLHITDKKKSNYFSWKRLGIPVFKTNKIGEVIELGHHEINDDNATLGFKTPLQMKARLVRGKTSTKWRRSTS